MKIKKQNIINFKRKVSRFGIALPLCSLFLTVFNRYLPYRIKHKLHQWKHCQTEKYIYNIIGQFQIQNTVSEYCNNPKEAPIWYCWLQGENSLPAIPRLCLDSLKKNANNHPVYFITSENYKQYVNIPYRIETLFNEGKISYAHFSDILRFNLINQNGGLWVDSTILLTSPIDEAIFEQQFYSIKIQEFGNFISRCRWCGFFIVGAKHNKLTSTVCDIFNRYWAHEDCLIDYFLIDYAINIAYESDTEIKNIIDNINPSNPHIYSLSSCLSENYTYDRIKLLTSDTAIFKLNWKQYTENELLDNPNNIFNYFKNSFKEQ